MILVLTYDKVCYCDLLQFKTRSGPGNYPGCLVVNVIAMEEMMIVQPLEMVSFMLLATRLGASDRTMTYMTFVFSAGVLPMVNNFVTNLHRFMVSRPRDLLWLPMARVHMMEVDCLERNTLFRIWYTVNCYIDLVNEYINTPTMPVLMPPCTWCGLPTGNWCDGCEEQGDLPARAICTECENRRMECRFCIEY